MQAHPGHLDRGAAQAGRGQQGADDVADGGTQATLATGAPRPRRRLSAASLPPVLPLATWPTVPRHGAGMRHYRAPRLDGLELECAA